jgi:hypothetical protein
MSSAYESSRFEVQFEIEKNSGGQTVCAMWLGSYGGPESPACSA